MKNHFIFFGSVFVIALALSSQALAVTSHWRTQADCEKWLANAEHVFINNGPNAATPLFVLQSPDGKTVSFGPNFQRNPELVSFKAELLRKESSGGSGGAIELYAQYKEMGHTFYRPRNYSLIVPEAELIGVIEGKILLVSEGRAGPEKNAWLFDYRSRDRAGQTEMFPLYEDSSGVSNLVFFEGGQAFRVVLKKIRGTTGFQHKIQNVERIDFLEGDKIQFEAHSFQIRPQYYTGVFQNGLVINFRTSDLRELREPPQLVLEQILREMPLAEVGIKEIKPRTIISGDQYWLGFNLIYGDQFTDDHAETHWLLRIPLKTFGHP